MTNPKLHRKFQPRALVPRVHGRHRHVETVRLLAALLCLLTSTARGAKPDPFLVAIHTGDGGSDHGTVFQKIGVSISEKEITLKLAMTAANEMRAKGIRVILNRAEDKE